MKTIPPQLCPQADLIWPVPQPTLPSQVTLGCIKSTSLSRTRVTAAAGAQCIQSVYLLGLQRKQYFYDRHEEKEPRVVAQWWSLPSLGETLGSTLVLQRQKNKNRTKLIYKGSWPLPAADAESRLFQKESHLSVIFLLISIFFAIYRLRVFGGYTEGFKI